MAIEIQDLKLLIELRRKYPQGEKLCILGDCHFYFKNNILFKMSHYNNTDCFNYSSNATIESFGKALGFKTVETIDIFGKPTHKLDLQKSLPIKLFSKFDWIIDSGTLYWCFDIASVWKNILLLLKKKGFIFHTSSLTGYFGRGYYSFQPRLFTDFYKQNGFQIITLGYRVRPAHIIHNKHYLLSLLYLLIRKIRGIEKKLEWQLFSPENIYLKSASRLDMKFQKITYIPEPDIIPNSALLLCFAQRLKKTVFKIPLLID